MKWKNLQIPKGYSKDDSSDEKSNYGKFVVEPLERGFGITIGNALRRTLLSSLTGAAVTHVRIGGVQHEFSTIPGIAKEDVSEVMLNLKKLRFNLKVDEPVVLKLDVQGEGAVTAENFEENPDCDIISKDQHVCTINEDADLSMEITVSPGRGYKTAEMNKRENDPIAIIPIDANFSPVTKVNFSIENTRVGQRLDYDKLLLEIWTDGSIKPEDALAYAAKLLSNNLKIFINFEGELKEAEEAKSEDADKKRIRELLKMRVDELELSVRSSNCLRLANIHTIEDLVKNKESEILKYKNFGRKSLIELNEILQKMGLSFGMDLVLYRDN
ncbi:MAG: DNA-directed RNA polymerase subunit alpha [Candidatus Raymondbacteria bacterium RifOxyA12_full_50_37]|uniref:DNA-directed RNA polymerase subunit alpha n=1 Tax=Candidatus Raymondbacteria bacterium RIFOXYD12_FULL_49_13 TaxID=1817890 RepID=A0A1F7FD60_UNCRA|nr:MAG: DNA-directed RNA polymerase subunit alpha [Candidatus Raymondbacteria bacterium RifOxyA12_full_50_37]OGJ94079.1 MAG: DNA-directed RNA polymerase subunit alpha [Candidatus Raymondbacteria bacterium RIFOXYA2_FULL_49_16]OGJ96834.1 MAG: DNA-directed RNA polymerase subunit alpha [Candidatus Raymondbacteria bacterium RifOxyC12_full_50_8]OGJ96904.1 MAG: DNA-directed RNA polymerase subunit alpha [Candidatus Raymondbacteria bacterium RIFOXYC2_FULL_50_21]OGK01506.1 MAG: DNA-directed RNA polymeras